MKTNDKLNGARICVYGAQYGSEGKGCFAEFMIQRYFREGKIVVLGENAPNSGHTNSIGKTRSLPVSAFYAQVVILGPDSAIDPELLKKEVLMIREKNPSLEVYVHENAARISANDIVREEDSKLAERIGSTQTGGGNARSMKALHRAPHLIMRSVKNYVVWPYKIVDHMYYMELLESLAERDWLFECSQGLWLDLNLSWYPYCTSRTTNPRAAIERNGLGPSSKWQFIGVHRTYPIRTGGNSGPTYGRELSWGELKVQPEIAVVTKRVRRVFELSPVELLLELRMIEPGALAFTHLDYLPEQHRTSHGFAEWLRPRVGGSLAQYRLAGTPFYLSDAPGNFRSAGNIFGHTAEINLT